MVMTIDPLDLTAVGMALASRTRTRMVSALAAGSKTITQLAHAVGVHQSTASYHCGLLQDAGLVRVQSSGTRRYVTLRASEVHLKLRPSHQVLGI
jgi:DNA-binding transcriptional ArsR family regulator